MAQKNRADLQAVIDANLPDNTTDFITPLLHREVEEDLKDSNFNKLDDTAFDVNYPPTTPLDWDATVPTETGGALDILIKKVSTNPSQDLAYVANSGSDAIGEFEVGNPLKPFLTIQAAIDSTANDRNIKIQGGTYIEDITILNKDNVFIDAKGCIITGDISFTDSFNCGIDLRGSVVNGFVNLGVALSRRNSLLGGIINTNDSNTSLVLGDGSVVSGTQIKNNSTGRAIGSNNDTPSERAFITNCRIESLNNTAVYRCQGTTFDTCYIEGVKGIETNSSVSDVELSKFIDCITIGRSSDAITGEGSVVRIEYTGGYVRTLTGQAILMGGTSNYVMFKNTTIVSELDCIYFFDTLLRGVGINTVFDGCRIYTISGNIFREQNVPLVGDVGTTQVINCTFNKAYTSTNLGVKYFEYNTTTIIGLQIPAI